MEPQRLLLLLLLDAPDAARRFDDLVAELGLARSEVVGAAEELVRVGLVDVDGEDVLPSPAAVRLDALGLIAR
jgi:DNA-binding IclR family transcriptional regulator